MKSRSLLSFLIGSLLLVPFASTNAVIKSLNDQKGHEQFFANDANVGIGSADNVHTINWTGVLQPSRGGTGASSFATSSVLFFSRGKISENNSAFFWDDVNSRLGIGTSNPVSTLTVVGEIRTTMGGIRFPDGTVQTTAATPSQWTTTSTGIYFNSGNVGIGTANPSGPLEVSSAGNSVFKVGTDGIVNIPRQSAVKAHIRFLQTINSGETATVNLDVVDWDTQGEFDPVAYAFTAKQPGYYLGCANVYWQNPPDQMNHIVIGASPTRGNVFMSSWKRTSGAHGQATGPYCGVFPLGAGESVYLTVFQNSGSPVTVGEIHSATGEADRESAWMSITKLF